MTKYTEVNSSKKTIQTKGHSCLDSFKSTKLRSREEKAC